MLQLRLGVRGLGGGDRELRIELNGVVQSRGNAADRLIPFTGKASRGGRQHPAIPEAYLHMVPAAGELRQGINELTLTLEAADVRAMVEVVEVQLAVFGR